MIGNIVKNSVLGIAYLGAVCHLSLRAALAEDHAYTFATVGVTAHELAHALGSAHDGDVPTFATLGKKPKICDPSNGNTMAPTAGGENFGVFSECSLDQMSSFAGSLTDACFKLASSKNYTIPEKTFHGETWDRFKHKAANKTFYCQSLYPQFWRVTGRDHEDYSHRCKLLCCPALQNTCFIHDMADGMECGRGKVCIRHVCATPGRHPTARPRRTTMRSTTTTSTTPRNRPGWWPGRYRTRFPRRYHA
uniref:Putative tick metalloprotease n=1 Tax=Ixodes ricinus TaxID=34613 RepID=V5GMI2_IXORI